MPHPIPALLRRAVAPLLLAALAAGCAAPATAPDADLARRLDALLPADVLLLGEQHDAPQHHELEREVVQALAARGQLAALAMEMADRGTSTAALPRGASPSQLQAALHWNDAAWPWAAYGPVVTAAQRAGVPVLGANLPRSAMPAAMADAALDQQLNGPALKAQQQAIRIGHCGRLPESQIRPMTRIQVARDRAMAQTLAQAVQQAQARRPGQTVLLIAGAGHANKVLGVAQHLPHALRVKAVRMEADGGNAADTAPDPVHRADFDATWHTPALAHKDYCAGVGA